MIGEKKTVWGLAILIIVTVSVAAFLIFTTIARGEGEDELDCEHPGTAQAAAKCRNKQLRENAGKMQ